MVNSIVQHRRGHVDSWRRSIIVPEDGELIIVEFDDGSVKCKVGDGINRFTALKYVDDATRTELLAKVTALEKAVDTKVRNATTYYTNKIALAKEELAQQVIPVEEKLKKLNASLTALSNSLDGRFEQITQSGASNTETLQQQIEQIQKEILALSENESISAERLSDVVSSIETIMSELTDLAEDDAELVEKVYSVENTLTEDIKQLKSANSNTFKNIQKNFDSISNELESNKVFAEVMHADTLESVNEFKQEINDKATDLYGKMAEAHSRLTLTEAKVATQSKRIDTLMALPEGSTMADAELMDLRAGYDGLVYSTAGEAVRQIGYDLEELKSSLPDYIPANAVDGLLYENSQLYLTSGGEPVGEPVTITGGSGGGSSSTVKVTNNLPATSIAQAAGTEVYIDFTYTSFENEVATGDGHANIIINNNIISAISGTVLHGVAKRINITSYLKPGANTVKVTCSDQYGVSRSLVYNISIIDLRVTSTFDPTYIFDTSNPVLFRYTVTGQVEKTIHILLDGEEYFTATQSASASGKASTLSIPKLSHGCHKLQAYAETSIAGNEVRSNILEYDILWVETDSQEAMIASVYNVSEVTQGDLVSIPFMVYDPTKAECTVDMIVYSQIAGEEIEVDRTTLVVDRTQQFWNTRKYPAGKVIFTISYTYTLYGVQHTLTKSHTLNANALDIDIEADDDSLQLYLSAQGRLNSEQNPASWTFTPKATNGIESPATITTTFSNFNWKSNGWIADKNGDTCLRLNGDARATINFKPFTEDFKRLGKTIEFEFCVRDVNSREAVVIDCFGSDNRGFKATPDTAFLQSGGNSVSCRYKDEERVRIAVTVEPSSTISRFISIYLDGVLSGVKRYADTDGFSQMSPVNITLGSNLCGLDLYSVRVYDKALTAAQILDNYIADQADPSTKLQLFTNNDILDDNDKVSYERVKALGQIPIVTFTGPMPTYKGDKKKKLVRMKFEDPLHPELNFDVLLDQIDVQGTSSQFYVRKNWKVTLPEERAHMVGAIPTKVFCLKVDYAEATGTHNTGTANFVEALYDRSEVLLPPQKDDARVRTTIQGFPCVIFEKTSEDAEPVFSSKANFNYDKGSEAAFGFTEDYDDYGVECWEFCNNTSPSCNFTGSIATDWSSDFEPRYVPESANYDRIEELLELKESAANGKATITADELAELETLQTTCIANFKQMHDWVISTATYELEFDDEGKIIGRKPITPKPLAQAVTYGDTTYTEDNEDYRLAKFKNEFNNYFNMHYCSTYYVFTFFALMTDQRAKNMFLTRWKDEDGVYRWYPYFYDNDTIFGINNEGALVFDYYHEDTDQLGSANVYNGQNSILWNNFRRCFPADIVNTYSTMRSSKKLTYDAIMNQYVTEGSDKWSAAIYNEDAEYKYVSMAREIQTEGEYAGSVDDSNLYQVRGPGEHHLRYFVDNRINYCDSKWYAGDYPDDYIFLRIYTPTLTEITDDMSDARKAEVEALNDRISKSLEVVPANPNITVTPFSNMYAGVKYKANGVLQQQRLERGQSYTFAPPTSETFNDTETGIYGASELTSLGDLSGLYCGVISLGKASKLTDITIGNPDPNYHNDNFREIRVGANRLLRSIDLRNCSGLGSATGSSIDSGWTGSTTSSAQTTLDLSGCPNIERIYTEGTNLQTVALPESGYVKVLHLPASTTILNIKNQQNIEDFSIESYDKLRTLCIENCPTLDTNSILAACTGADGKYTVERVRLTGLNWNLTDASFIKSLYPKFDEDGNFIGGIRGIDENNFDLDEAYLVGTCHIDELTGAEYAEIKEHYPFLDITYGSMTSEVIFKYSDIDGNEYEEKVSFTNTNSALGDVSDFVPAHTPAWPENDAFTYELFGWSRKQQTSKGLADKETDYLDYVQADATTGIVGNRTLYPVFRAIRKSYPITFINPTAAEGAQFIETVNTPYGGTAVSSIIPTKQDVESPELYEFTGWHPSPANITGPLTCYAQFAVLDSVWYTLTVSDIPSYEFDNTAKTISITKCANSYNAAVRIPEQLTVNGSTYTVVGVKGFEDNDKLELIKLPETITTILSTAFNDCNNLSAIDLHEGITSVGTRAFDSCISLTALHIPASLTNIAERAFTNCTALQAISVAEDNPVYKVLNDCLINANTKTLLVGLTTSIIPQDGSVTALQPYCFARTGISTVQIPAGVQSIPTNAFSYCSNLESLSLPATLKTIEATCFGWCSKLKAVEFPPALTEIRSYAFVAGAMEEVTIPASVTTIQDHAFGEQKKLRVVTFEKKLDANGNIVAPFIHKNAFASSGDTDGIVFNVPWEEGYQYNYAESQKQPDGSTIVVNINPEGWGASNWSINYNYKG